MIITTQPADFEAKLAATRVAIAARHAERAVKARDEKSASEAKAAGKAKRRADAQAATIEERRLAHEARADEQRRLKNQTEAEARQAEQPKAPAADAFPEILSDGIVRSPILAKEMWDSLHPHACRRLMQLTRPDLSPAEAARAARLLSTPPATLGATVREEILRRVQKETTT